MPAVILRAWERTLTPNGFFRKSAGPMHVKYVILEQANAELHAAEALLKVNTLH